MVLAFSFVFPATRPPISLLSRSGPSCLQRRTY